MTPSDAGPTVPPTVRSSGSRAGRLIGLAPVALVIVAEAAWLSVLAGLSNGFGGRPPALGIPLLAAFVIAGIAAARILGPRMGDAWPIVALVLVGLGSVIGWLASPAARLAVGDGPAAVIAANPGGWVAGLAILRGFAHASWPIREDAIGRLFRVGVPGLVVLAVTGGLLDEPYRSMFEADTLVAAVVFAVSATLAVALVRMTGTGLDSGFDWRRNPAWLGLVLVVLVVTIVVAVELWVVGGSMVQVVLGISIGALLIIALAAGLDRTAFRVVVFLLAFQLVVYGLVSRIEPGDRSGDQAPVAPPPPAGPVVIDAIVTVAVGGLALLIAIVVILILAAVWMRRTGTPAEDPVEETRSIDRGGTEAGAGTRPGRRWPRFFRSRPEPADAAAAYLALLADLEPHEDVRRAPAETPAEHVARLRAADRTGLAMDLLAADYALTRYAAVELSAREDDRAVARWRDLRRRVPHRD